MYKININFKSYEPSIYIFRYGKYIYYQTKDINIPVQLNNETIEVMKDKVILPLKINFSGLSRAQIGKIIGYIKQDDVNIFAKEYYKPINKKYNLLCYDVLFVYKKDIKFKKLANLPKVKIKTTQNN